MKKISRDLHLHSGREEAGRGWRTVDKLVSGTSLNSCEVLLVLVSGTSSTSGHLLSDTRCLVSDTVCIWYQAILGIWYQVPILEICS